MLTQPFFCFVSDKLFQRRISYEANLDISTMEEKIFQVEGKDIILREKQRGKFLQMNNHILFH